MKSAHLSTAYVYDCDECGGENFVRAAVVEESEQESIAFEELRLRGVDPDEVGLGGQWVTVPETVTCQHCGTKFKAFDNAGYQPE